MLNDTAVFQWAIRGPKTRLALLRDKAAMRGAARRKHRKCLMPARVQKGLKALLFPYRRTLIMADAAIAPPPPANPDHAYWGALRLIEMRLLRRQLLSMAVALRSLRTSLAIGNRQ